MEENEKKIEEVVSEVQKTTLEIMQERLEEYRAKKLEYIEQTDKQIADSEAGFSDEKIAEYVKSMKDQIKVYEERKNTVITTFDKEIALTEEIVEVLKSQN